VAVLPIRIFGDPVLRTPADPVVDFDAKLHRFVQDMIDTMTDEGGAGLAAPQVGVSLRVFTYDVHGEVGHLINPELSFPDEEEQTGPEGCLSIPGLFYDTTRRMNVVARGVNMHGEPVELTGTELMSRCIQHETDHLDGVLFIDRLDPATRREAMRAIREAEWAVPMARGADNPRAPGGLSLESKLSTNSGSFR